MFKTVSNFARIMVKERVFEKVLRSVVPNLGVLETFTFYQQHALMQATSTVTQSNNHFHFDIFDWLGWKNHD